MKSVLFVCTGNTCRSPMAEALLRDRLEKLGISGVSVGSAGLAAVAGASATPEAIRVLGEVGIDHSSHRSRPWTEDLADRDLILTMEQRHKEAILQRFPLLAGRVFTLKEFAGHRPEEGDVEDPLKCLYDPGCDPLEEYRKTRVELEGAIEAMIPRLLEFLGLREEGGRP
ncbi:MAG: low molecular weight protein arginine phosphatase [Betaproteobacteria bacterium]